MSRDCKDVKVAIIGAGFGGILAALRLKKTPGLTNFTIYEKEGDIGGTWRDNVYPGCSIDTDARIYGLSCALNPDWSKSFPDQPEILRYQRDIVESNGIQTHIQLNSKLVGSEWVVEKHGYILQIERSDPQGLAPIRLETAFANVIIQALGGANQFPKYPPIWESGADVFGGDMFHSARWRTDVDLAGQRIGVIGNAASATQIVPELSKDPSAHVVNFCRSPNWFATRPQQVYSKTTKWIYRNIPLVHRVSRLLYYIKYDLQWFAFLLAFSHVRTIVEWYFTKYLKSQAPEKYHSRLMPTYPIGCKRIIRDPEYLSSLHRPNVELEWEPIDRIVRDGVVLRNGKHICLDVIVAATGFHTSSEIALPISGRNGVTMHDYWQSQGGPTAYRGTTIPNFPNVFTLLGPNIGTGHTSVLIMMETQMDYIIKLLKPMLRPNPNIASIEVKGSACDKYNTYVQKRVERTVWASCASYYNQYGEKNVSQYPGSATWFWLSMLWPRWSDYVVTRAVPSTTAHANGRGNGDSKPHFD